MEERQERLSRRKFLAGAGALAAGTVAAEGFLGFPSRNLASAGEAVKVLVNDKEITGPVPPRIVNGTALVPVRPLAESLGAEVSWESGARVVRVKSRAASLVAAAPAWPWPYKKLDPEMVRQRAYDGYYEGA